MPTTSPVKPTHIVDEHLQGVKKRLASVFLMPEPVITFSNNPIAEFLQRAANQQDNPNISYPFTYIRPRTVQLNNETYPARRLAKSKFSPFLRTVMNDEDQMVEIRFIPVIYAIEVGYIHDDAMEYLKFTADWVQAAAASDLNFRIRHMGIGLDIQVELADNWEIPEQDKSGTAPTQTAGTAQILVKGYTARTNKQVVMVPKIKTVQTTVVAGDMPAADELNTHILPAKPKRVDQLPNPRQPPWPGFNLSKILR